MNFSVDYYLGLCETGDADERIETRTYCTGQCTMAVEFVGGADSGPLYGIPSGAPSGFILFRLPLSFGVAPPFSDRTRTTAAAFRGGKARRMICSRKSNHR